MASQSAAGVPHLGVTPPISLSPPSARDLEVTKTLVQELKHRGQYASVDDGKQRENVLGRLNTLVKQFVYKSSINHGLSEAKAKEAGGKIFTFGSYRLGVHGPGADIDTLLVVPKHVQREEFFELFEEMLKATDGVSEVTAVPEAFVPIIKCVISGVEIDLLFARLALSSVPDDLSLRDDGLLRNLDERCVRSMNGSRVTDEILRLVPNVQVFREALRTVKLWAKQRAIYSNVMGFLGGVAWAMLVARICQLYPQGCAGSIISRFFIIMGQWQWPQPVLLKPIEEGPLQVRVWNPKLYPSDRAHRMPIITPAYPSMCSTHNVTLSTQSIMTAELKRAADIVDRVFIGTATWSELFAPHDFFKTYRYYLQITASSGDADVQLKWSGTVESRVRQLVMKLEYVDTLTLAHPYVKGFDRVNYCVDEAEQRAVSIGEVPTAVAMRTESDMVEGQGGVVHTTTFYIGLMIERKPCTHTSCTQHVLLHESSRAFPYVFKAAGNGPRKLDISYPTNEFTKLVKMWDKYDPETMGVIVRYIKSSALPAYVHEGREADPIKSGGTKRTKSKPANASVNGAPNDPFLNSNGSSTTAASGQQQSMVEDDSSTEQHVNKKLRASSFVPEPAPTPPLSTMSGPVNDSMTTETQGQQSAPHQSLTSTDAALAAAELATAGQVKSDGAAAAAGAMATGTTTTTMGQTMAGENATTGQEMSSSNAKSTRAATEELIVSRESPGLGSDETAMNGAGRTTRTTVSSDENVNGNLPPGLASVHV
ncbi:polynucleotide adenylyltransferase [Microbotryomycetes sp. JL201]|nr:polynucleotide adenylyltransferase [Microbotryomycetes sp. JL201]